jgi:hypothetical protein
VGTDQAALRRRVFGGRRAPLRDDADDAFRDLHFNAIGRLDAGLPLELRRNGQAGSGFNNQRYEDLFTQ